MENLEQTLTEWLAPIRPEAPAGDDLSYSVLFDEIREARRSDDPALAQGDWEQEIKSADWRRVVRLCGDALNAQSKDLQLVVWLAEALTHTHGFSGAGIGLRLLSGWLQQYWDSGYPALDGGDLDERIGKIEWLSLQLGQALRTVPLTAAAHGGYHWNDWRESRDVDNLGLKDAAAKSRALAEGKLSGEIFDKSVTASGAAWFAELAVHIEAATADYHILDETAMERFGDDFPSFADIWQALRAIKEVVDRVAPPTPVAIEKTAAPAAPLRSKIMPTLFQSVSAPEPTAHGGPLQSREDAIRMLDEVARYFRAHEPHSPVSLLAERAARWAEMSLEQWLAHVIKDGSTLNQLQELLDVKPDK